MQTKHLFQYFNEVFPRRWEVPALSDYKGTVSYTYGEVATQVARLGVMMEQLGVEKGDKVAMCGRNSANWAVSYLGISIYGGVIVSILQDFKGEDVQGLVNHSDATLMFVGPYVWKTLDPAAMPNLKAIISIEDFSLLYAPDQEAVQAKLDGVEAAFQAKYPNGFTKEDVNYRTDNLDDLMLINYTSGSTGTPKGVMLSYRNLSNNVANAIYALPNQECEEIVSMLPLAHMYGQLGEFLFQICTGCHVYFLTKTPTPALLLQALADVKPYIMITVPLVIEKIYKKSIYPVISKGFIRAIWHVPGLGHAIRAVVRKKLMKAFGGNIRYLLLGGAALNPEAERALLDMKFPLTIGYGMTECAPLITGSHPKKFKYRSTGKVLPGMEAKLDNPNAEGVGEILVRGANVMMGYYKNPEATAAALDSEGWLHTGDLGCIDKQNFIYLRGRNKNMILGASGQNIYPEEIEDKLNNQAGVVESVVVERDGKLIGLVFPDLNEVEKSEMNLTDFMKENLAKLNALLPKYSQVHDIEVVEKEFEKTPKKSIKRFLYK